MKLLRRIIICAFAYFATVAVLGGNYAARAPVGMVVNGLLFAGLYWAFDSGFRAVTNAYVRGLLKALSALLVFALFCSIAGVLVTYLLWRDE